MNALFGASLLLAAAAAPAQSGSALEQFFVGTTEGSGTVSVAVAGKHGVKDRSRGRRDAQGALILDQVVEEEGKPARRRTWRLVRSGPSAVTGTISDAKGPVKGQLTGNTLHISYKLAEGPSVEQWITLQPGGRSASNRMVFRRFGFKLATVESTIRKVQ